MYCDCIEYIRIFNGFVYFLTIIYVHIVYGQIFNRQGRKFHTSLTDIVVSRVAPISNVKKKSTNGGQKALKALLKTYSALKCPMQQKQCFSRDDSGTPCFHL